MLPPQVTNDNKREYVNLVARHRMTTAIRAQIEAFLKVGGRQGCITLRWGGAQHVPCQRWLRCSQAGCCAVTCAGLLGGCAPQAHLHLTILVLFLLQGFWEIVPRKLISIFNDHELELLISGLPEIDVDDLRAHTDYQGELLTTLVAVGALVLCFDMFGGCPSDRCGRPAGPHRLPGWVGGVSCGCLLLPRVLAAGCTLLGLL